MINPTHAAKLIHAGFKDGWTQPHDLTWSHNVEALTGKDSWQYQELLDRAICIGQLARAGRGSETWHEGFWPVSLIRRPDTTDGE